MKKGFTLIELIGVIVLLSLIMLISFPIILNQVTNTKKELSESEKQVIYSGTSMYITKYQNNYTKIDGNIYCINVLDLEKEQLLPRDLSNHYEFVQATVKQNQYEYELKDSCTPDYLVNVKYEVIGEPFNRNNWAKSDFYVDIVALGATKIKWCTSNNGECNPVAEVEGEKATVMISNESTTNQICAIAYVYQHEKEKVCSDIYKLDKIPPQFTGLNDAMVYLDNTFNASDGVNVSDSLSGMDGSYQYEPLAIDNTKIGTVGVIYSAVDQAGNRARVTRNIDVKNPYSVYVTNNSISVYDISIYNKDTKLMDVYTLFFQSEIALKEYEESIVITDVFPLEHFSYLDVVSASVIEDSTGIQKFYTLKNKVDRYNTAISSYTSIPNFTVNDITNHLLKSSNYAVTIEDGFERIFYLYRNVTSTANVTSHNTTLKNGTAVSLYYSLVKSTIEIDGDMNGKYEWTEWTDVSYPQYGPTYGDYETYDNIRNANILTNVSNDDIVDITCRAVKFPNYRVKELGQIVTCDKKVGLICNNRDQVPGPIYPVDMCINYEIKVRYKVQN